MEGKSHYLYVSVSSIVQSKFTLGGSSSVREKNQQKFITKRRKLYEAISNRRKHITSIYYFTSIICSYNFIK